MKAKAKIGAGEAMGSVRCYKCMRKKYRGEKRFKKGNYTVADPPEKDIF